MTTTPAKALPPVRRTAFVRALMVMATAAAGILLLSDLPLLSARLHAFLSALPLAIAGVAYSVLQLGLRPALRTMLKRLLLAATFAVWAVDQLLPPGRLATFIGDLVIAAYVLDLYWLIQEQMASVHSTSGSRGGRSA
jgi:hypothetical protein